MEAVAYVAGEPWSDHPQCASRVLTKFLISLNDRLDDERRQILKPFIPRLVGTNTGPEDEEKRRWMIAEWLVHEYAPAVFRATGNTAEAERFEQLAAITGPGEWEAARKTIYEVRDAAWERRQEAVKRLKAAVAVAVADADAAAVAVAVADAAAAPLLKAVEAAATSKANGGGYWDQWQAAYDVMRPHYDERYRDAFDTAGLRESVLQLIDRLIEVSHRA